MTLSLVLYCGLFLLLVSVAALVRPLRRMGIPNRMVATALMLVSLTMIGAVLAWPVPRTKSGNKDTLLGRSLPQYQFDEHHEVTICAPPARIMEAVRGVSAEEIRFFRALIAIRRLHRVSSAREKEPLLEVAQRGGFVALGEIADREIALGTAGPFWAAGVSDIADAGLLRIQLLSSKNDPARFAHLELRGYPKAVIHFLLKEGAGGCHVLVTETRIGAPVADSARKFARYWRLIYPGSALIRVMWLDAIKRRAEMPR
ncbi:MAG: hypothetical protein JNL98_20680 [Bryobacterales bacterium]|nr:hypothetical protein [Bryobacterales bacterium]